MSEFTWLHHPWRQQAEPVEHWMDASAYTSPGDTVWIASVTPPAGVASVPHRRRYVPVAENVIH